MVGVREMFYLNGVIPVSRSEDRDPQRQIVGMTYWVYILANTQYGTLYVGVTNSLERRISEHKTKAASGFTAKHDVGRLVFFRGFGDVAQAIHFEKQLKRWRREWKIRLIEADNPHWEDLYLQMMRVEPVDPAMRVPVFR